ncbi:MAG: hypothetical protein QM589_03715 [Thermomicrobiales bacterium]
MKRRPQTIATLIALATMLALPGAAFAKPDWIDDGYASEGSVQFFWKSTHDRQRRSP